MSDPSAGSAERKAYLNFRLIGIGEPLEALHLVGRESIHGEGEGGERERERRNVPVEIEVLLVRERVVRTEMIPSRF